MFWQKIRSCTDDNRTPSLSAKCPLIPHNPLCLQAGDPCVSLCVCGCMCMSLCQIPGLVTSANCGYSHNAMETHFPISLSVLTVTSGLSLSQPPVKPYHVLCLSLGGTRAIKYQNKATLVLPSVNMSATSV